MLLKTTEKIIRENAFEQNKNKPSLNLTLGLMLIGLRTTGPCYYVRWTQETSNCSNSLGCLYINLINTVFSLLKMLCML